MTSTTAAIIREIPAILAGIAAIVAAYHGRKASKKADQIKVNVNGNIDRLLSILEEASIVIPHETATKVVEAPPQDLPTSYTTEEKLIAGWLNKLRQGGKINFP